MKLMSLVIPKYAHSDAFGDSIFSNVLVTVDSESGDVAAESFDPESTEYYLPAETITYLGLESARRFLNERTSEIVSGRYSLSLDQLRMVQNCLMVNRSEFADLLGMHKGTITRIFSGELALQKDVQMLIVQRLKDEVECPGISKRLLDKIRQRTPDTPRILKNLSAVLVAEYFIKFFEGIEDSITHLKLQKLLYYAQGIGFGRFNCRLMSARFVAWDHGPVVEEVWREYKRNQKNPLSHNENLPLDELSNDEMVMDILKETISFYGRYSAWALREKTHAESPWVDTEPFKEITEEKIINFFQKTAV